MQFKLYNFHNFLGNFATTLVGAFIPLIIYKSTSSIRLAVLFLLGQGLCRIIANYLFKKLCATKPQLVLILRIIPLTIYNICLIYLDSFVIPCIVLIMISYGVSLSLKNNATNVLLNYMSKKKSESKLTRTRIVGALSAIVAAVAGGIFIDWNQTLLIIFSLSLYLISVVPLFVHYLFNKDKDGFNKDFISNMAIIHDKQPQLKEKRKSLVKKFLLNYFLFYGIFCVVDNFTSMYTLYLFIDVPTFTKAGYVNAMFQLANLIGVLLVNLISKKYDLKFANMLSGILCGVSVTLIPFVYNNLLVVLLFFIFGVSYAICSYFMMNSLMTKGKIVGCSNEALLCQQDGVIAGQMVNPIIIIIIAEIKPVFFVMFGTLLIYSIYTYIAEQKMRDELVDYLEDNEIETNTKYKTRKGYQVKKD